ncbi:hypothetical protein CUR178_03357 [Leishmania enriettii]|uniref:Uncharacterized protein n=1 Tax=Leishmania enriettii TaxID=5663 RepID=A0A836GQS9_LEIEN|nr:hypothetical protein CUR178_03357 [Leishmania enriettii]
MSLCFLLGDSDRRLCSRASFAGTRVAGGAHPSPSPAYPPFFSSFPFIERNPSYHHYSKDTGGTEDHCALVHGMPLVSASVPANGGSTGASARLIHAVCAIDDHTLIFVIASAAVTDSAAHSSFDAALLSFGKTANHSSESTPRGPRGLSYATTCHGAIRAVLYACSVAGSCEADLALSAYEGCAECPACCREAKSADGVGDSFTPPISSSHSRHCAVPPEHAAAVMASLSDSQSDSMAALRASQLTHISQLGDAAAKASPAGFTAVASATSSQPPPTLFSTDNLVALHVARQEAWQCSPGAPNAEKSFAMAPDAACATVLSADVLCYFVCGCAALATFKLTRHSSPAEWSVQLSGCVWIPFDASPAVVPCRSAGAAEGWTSQRPYATGAPLVSSLVRPLPSTVCREASAAAVRDGRKSMLELLVVWCSPTVASVSPALSPSPCARPVVRYASLRGCDGSPATVPAVASEWRLHTQAIFDMSELLHFTWRASPCSNDVHNSVRSFDFVPHASVRSLNWLPGTADFKQSYPLLAVLYAAPIVQSRRADGVNGAPPEPCLDSLAVCYLKEDGHHSSSASDPAVATPHKTPTTATGRLLLGPWLVRGVSLAHPHFLFATALAGPRSPSSAAPPATNTESAAVPTASASSTAQAFRAALHSSADAAAVLLGVFQRPAQEPYATSCLFRGRDAAVDCRGRGGRTIAGAQLVSGEMARMREHSHLQRGTGGQDTLNAPGNSNVFAFVLYGSNGEEARCILDGYVNDAQTTLLDTRITPTDRGGDLRASGDLTRRGGEGERRTVARVCAVLSEKPSTLSEAREHCQSAVVMTIQAQWTRTLPTVAARRHCGSVCSNNGRLAGGHWSFSVHVSRILRASEVPRGPLPHPWCATPVAMLGRILCWRSTTAGSEAASGDIRCLVCGYATTPHHDSAVVREAGAPYHTVFEGVFELRLRSSDMNGTAVVGGYAPPVTQATNAAVGMAAGGGRPTSRVMASPSESSTALAGLRPWAVGSCTRVVSPSAFAALLHCASAADTLTTAFDLLSHTPTFPVAAARLGATVSAGVVPVAIAWIAGGVCEADADALARRDSSSATAAASSKSSILSYVRELDAVALLRSGDVVGWRCACHISDAASASTVLPSGEGAVVHLGALCWGPAGSITPSLKQLFLESLMNRGAGADAVHMEVIVVPMEGEPGEVGHRQARANLPSMEDGDTLPTRAVAATAARSTVLLVLAVGSLVGVVDLATGAVVTVRDLRTDLPAFPEREDDKGRGSVASSASADGAAIATASVLRLEQLPAASSCGWMAAGDAAPGVAVGASWFFLWCGAREVRNVTTSLTFVLRLSFLCWADVVSAYVGVASSSAAGVAAPAASLLDSKPSPSPLIALQVDACWLGEAEPLRRRTAVSSRPIFPPLDLSARCAARFAAACVGWLPCTVAGVDDGVGCAAPPGAATSGEAAGCPADAAGRLASLSVCDTPLLRALWPVMTTTNEAQTPVKQKGALSSQLSITAVPRRRPPLRLLRWGSVAPRPWRPSSLLLHGLSAACVMEQLTGGTAEAAPGMPLNVVYRSLLSERCDANAAFTPPERDRDVGLLCRRTCRQVLYVSTLTLSVCADEVRPDEHEPASYKRTVTGSLLLASPSTQPARPSSDSTPWQVLLCTMLLDKDEGTSSANDSTGNLSGASVNCAAEGDATAATSADRRHAQVVSYLLCGVPAHASVVPPRQQPCAAAAAKLSPVFTWHWIPLYAPASLPVADGRGGGGVALTTAVAAGGVRVDENYAPLALTRVLPLPSRTCCSAATMPPTSASNVIGKSVSNAEMAPSYFYCEGVLTGPAAATAPHTQQACYCLSVQGHRLRHLLKRSAVAALTEGVEQVNMYAAVDPDLVRVVGTSPASHARVFR